MINNFQSPLLTILCASKGNTYRIECNTNYRNGEHIEGKIHTKIHRRHTCFFSQKFVFPITICVVQGMGELVQRKLETIPRAHTFTQPYFFARPISSHQCVPWAAGVGTGSLTSSAGVLISRCLENTVFLVFLHRLRSRS